MTPLTNLKKSSFKSSNSTLLVSILILTYSFLVWWPTRNLAYHWDSAAFVADAARFLKLNHFFPLLAPYSEFAHPPLLPLLIAFIWDILGGSQNSLITAGHLVIFPFLPILLGATYHLALHYTKKNTLAFLTTTYLATIPFVLAEYGMPYLDLAAGSMAATSLVLWIKHHPRWAILTLSIAVLFKYTVILIGIYYILCVLQRPKIYDLRSMIYDLKSTILYLTIPFFLIGLWLFYHHSQTGWWLTLPGRDTVLKTDPLAFIKSLYFVLYVIFWRQGRFLLTLISLGLLLKNHRLLKTFLPEIGTILLIFASFAFTGEFIPRYAIFILPLSLTLLIKILSVQISSFKTLVLIILAGIGLNLYYLHPTLKPTLAFEFRLNEDLSYKDHIQVGQLVANYLETNYPNANIYGGFPQNYQLTEPWQGYVSSPLNFKTCSSYISNPKSKILFYLHPYHHTQIECQQLLSTLKVQLIKTFEVNGKWAQIYALETLVPEEKSSTK